MGPSVTPRLKDSKRPRTIGPVKCNSARLPQTPQCCFGDCTKVPANTLAGVLRSCSAGEARAGLPAVASRVPPAPAFRNVAQGSAHVASPWHAAGTTLLPQPIMHCQSWEMLRPRVAELWEIEADRTKLPA